MSAARGDSQTKTKVEATNTSFGNTPSYALTFGLASRPTSTPSVPSDHSQPGGTEDSGEEEEEEEEEEGDPGAAVCILAQGSPHREGMADPAVDPGAAKDVSHSRYDEGMVSAQLFLMPEMVSTS